MARQEQLPIFVEEQLQLSGLFNPSITPDDTFLVSNHLANLQLSHGLSYSECCSVFLTSLYLVGLKVGLISVAVLVTPPLSPMGGTFCTESEQLC